LLFTLLFPAAGFGGQATVCDQMDFSKVVDMPPYEVAYKRPLSKDLCEVILKIKEKYVPVFVGRDFIIGGELFMGNRNVTLERIRHLMRRDFLTARRELETAVAFTYAPLGAKRAVYLFTDPQCPFCERAKKVLKDLADREKVKIKVVFLPLHAGSRNMAVRGICSRMTYQDYLAGRYGGKLCKAGRSKVRREVNLAKRLHVNATPTIITDTGERVVGLNLNKLEAYLEGK
jgi:thiol:disulfide interchange protein DsbC